MAEKQKLKNYLQQDILSIRRSTIGSFYSIIGALFIVIFLAELYMNNFSYHTAVNLLLGLNFIFIGTLYRKNGKALPKNAFFKSPIGIILLALLLIFGFLSFTN